MSILKNAYKFAFVYFLLMSCSEENPKPPVITENQGMEHQLQNDNRVNSNFLVFPSDSTWLGENNRTHNHLFGSDEYVFAGFGIQGDQFYLAVPGTNSILLNLKEVFQSNGYTMLNWKYKGYTIQDGEYRELERTVESVILLGENIFFAYDPNGVFSVGLFPRDKEMNFDVSEPRMVTTPENLEHQVIEYFFLDDGIQRISSSSELKENTDRGVRTYSVTRLKNRIVATGQGELLVHYRNSILCWAEGVSGPGIGEYLDISFTRPSDKLIVLNGYVDLIKRELYKQNNRLRTVKIVSENPAFETEYTFEDIVQFHEIPLPAATESVRLMIESVYQGSLFDDTCVSAIMLPQQRLRPEAEERQAIVELLKSRGYNVE